MTSWLTFSRSWLDSQACRWGTAALNWTSRFIANVWCTKNKFWKAGRFKLCANTANKLSKCFDSWWWFYVNMTCWCSSMFVDACWCLSIFLCASTSHLPSDNFAFLHMKPWRWSSAERFGVSWQNRIRAENDEKGFWVAQGLLIRKIRHQLRGLQHCNQLSINSAQYMSYSVLQHQFYWYSDILMIKFQISMNISSLRSASWGFLWNSNFSLCHWSCQMEQLAACSSMQPYVGKNWFWSPC